MAGLGLERCVVNLRATVEAGLTSCDEIGKTVCDKFCHRMTESGSEVIALISRVMHGDIFSLLINMALTLFFVVGMKGAFGLFRLINRLRGKAPPAPGQFELINDNHRGRI